MESHYDSAAADPELARATLQAIGDAVLTTAANGAITYLNPAAELLTGWESGEAIGRMVDDVLPLISENSREPIVNTALRCLDEARTIHLEEGALLVRRDGNEVPIGDSAAPIRDRHGDTIGVVLVLQDEAEKRRVGQRLSFEASHDSLTGLVNRREFERRLMRVVAQVPLVPAEHVLLCLDLDRFKVVNDTCGHDAGDELLRSLGPLLSRRLRKRDTLARLGGDEFGVLLENCPVVEAYRIAQNLRAEIEKYQLYWGGMSFSIGASIGLVPVTRDFDSITELLRVADAACYAAKEAGGNRVHIERRVRDSAPMSPATERRVTRLSRAVDQGTFHLFAQPIVALQPGLPVRTRLEILLRLPDSNGRMQVASDFLPQAERYNLMPAIDRWVVRETIALLGRWRAENPDAPMPMCSINLGASALADDSLIPDLGQQLAESGVPGEALCFEISETAALANVARTARFLTGIRDTGCATALEDFGTGVTSFSQLKTLPVDFLKIGGPLVRGVVDDPMCESIVGAVSQIGRSVGMSTIAKHVGSELVLDKLRNMGLDYAQGRALFPPMPLTGLDGRVALSAIGQYA